MAVHDIVCDTCSLRLVTFNSPIFLFTTIISFHEINHNNEVRDEYQYAIKETNTDTKTEEK